MSEKAGESLDNPTGNDETLSATFLESTPPGALTNLSNVCVYENSRILSRPDIQLHCDSDSCQVFVSSSALVRTRLFQVTTQCQRF